jgi:carbon-monoxide dehydrogenase large subunit
MGIAALLGTPVKRREDPRLITGQATYVDDIKLLGMLYMAVLRSPYGHARIKSINTEAARTYPGVKAVYTAADLKGVVGPVAVAVPLGKMTEGMGIRAPLADGKVRYYGDPVAVVIADDRYVARDARDLIEVDYEPLPAVTDVEKAAQEGAPLLYEEFGTNVALTLNLDESTEAIDKAFADTLANGGVVVKQRIFNQRLIPNAVETRGVVADFDKSMRKLTLWSSTQIPHILRYVLAATVGVPHHQVRVIAPEVGGGFGSKLNIYPEELVASFASMKLGRPIKWIEDRSENFTATTHGRDQVCYLEIAATRDGKITGLKQRVYLDMGAYSQLFSNVMTIAFMFPVSCGAYDIPVVHRTTDLIFTNKTPTDAYRGAGRPEATFAIERAIDLVARELQMDPVEIRRINFVKPEQFPYKSSTGTVYDSGNYEEALNKALALADYQGLLEEQARKRAEGKLMGIGFSTYIEACGIGPKGFAPVGLYESARIRVEASGTVIVFTGSSPHGQGEETSFAQIVSTEFGIPIEDIVVLHGDTDSTPEGRDTYGSRTTPVGGSAVFTAAQRLKEKMKHIASHMLEASPSDVTMEDGKFFVAGSPQKSVSFAEVAQTANLSNTLHPSIEPGLETTAFWEPTSNVFPFGTHICAVEIDKDTGETKITRYVAVDDCGNQLNPMLVEGQIHGGITQGIGQALLEGAIYSDDGQLLTGTLTDYAVPLSSELPSYVTDYTVTPTPVNPLGAKGIGEAGTIGSTPAVANAIMDALGIAHLDMPYTSEKLWNAIHAK